MKERLHDNYAYSVMANHAGLCHAIDTMVSAIVDVFDASSPTIYLYGSLPLGDFRLGWSDIDILVLTEQQITNFQAQKLLWLRQELLQDESDNPYYRSFEGGMLSLSAFLKQQSDRVVYWGTSGQRIADTYLFDSFCRTELLESSILLYGKDVRDRLHMPSYDDLYKDVSRHYDAILKYAKKTERSLYSFGWLLDIARGIYTVQTGNVISKTAAAEWVLENGLCPVPEELKIALQVRKAPLEYRNDVRILDYAETLGDAVQAFACVLGAWLKDSR